MANILDGICSEGLILDGLDDWPRSMSRKEWFAITRRIVHETIADLDLDDAALAEVEEAFIGVVLLLHESALPLKRSVSVMTGRSRR